MLTQLKCGMAAAAISLCMISGAQAQMKCDMSHGDKSMAMDSAGKSMDGILSIYEKNIVSAAEAMPADKFDFAPAQGDFAASRKTDFASPKPVASFAQQVRHLAQANYYFFGAGGAKPTADVKAIGSLKTKDEIVAALKASFAYAHQQVMAMTAANAFTEVEAEGEKSTRAASYAFGLAHMGDHYGQMVVYLRMNGIVPPASRKG